MSGPFTNLPGSQDPNWDRLVRALASIWDNQQRVQLLGHKDTGAGTAADIRYLASRATLYVQEHLQSTAASKGGATYSTSLFVSSVRQDCRQNRQQDQAFTRNAVDRYYLWLIPVFANDDGTFTKFDGVDGDDHALFADLGT